MLYSLIPKPQRKFLIVLFPKKNREFTLLFLLLKSYLFFIFLILGPFWPQRRTPRKNHYGETEFVHGDNYTKNNIDIFFNNDATGWQTSIYAKIFSQRNCQSQCSWIPLEVLLCFHEFFFLFNFNLNFLSNCKFFVTIFALKIVMEFSRF